MHFFDQWDLSGVTCRRKNTLNIIGQRKHTCEFYFGQPGVDAWQVGHVYFKQLPLFVQTCFFCLIRLHLDVRRLVCRRGTGLDIFCNQLQVGYFGWVYRIWAGSLNSRYSLHLSFDAVISLVHNILDLSLLRDGTLMKLTVILWHILQGNEEKRLVYWENYGLLRIMIHNRNRAHVNGWVWSNKGNSYLAFQEVEVLICEAVGWVLSVQRNKAANVITFGNILN